MRWYKITVGDQTWDATGDPNALNIELDITQYAQHQTGNKSYVRVWGIPLSLILTANKFNSKPISVYGGMQQGLPLANPAQQGLLAQGTVFPCVGNWVNTDMTLDFYFAPSTGDTTIQGSANLTHNWQQGQPLKQAMQQTLSTAFPKLTPKINISDNLVLNYTDVGIYQSLVQYAQYIYGISQNILGSTKGYQGVYISVNGNNINVQDGTQTQSGAGVINFQDLIGQPIWTGAKTVQWKTVMRGDFNIGQKATLPKSLATLTGGAGTAVGSGNSNIIQGSFTITGIRHVGNFRQPDWASWATIFDGTNA